MAKVKAGDKVRVIKCEYPSYWYADKINRVFTVSHTVRFGAVEVEEYNDHTIRDGDYELVEESSSGVPLVNALGGMKDDSDKVRPTILLKDLNSSVQAVIRVLEYGSKKYNRANYAKVENERYEDALGRHYMAYLAGEKNDPETGESHLAHVVCCALFMMQKEIESE